MTEQLPRRITASEIMVKDGVRAEVHRCNYREIHEGLVTELMGGHGIQIGQSDGVILRDNSYDWTLLSRPETSREVGSRWADDDSKVRYILASDGHYLPYNYRHQMLDSLVPGVPSDDRTIANLTPLDPS